jgi:ACS family tartrate transporter-like MFS transporter
MTATAVSTVIGSPISGALMEIKWGMSGWQWLFLLEGLPAVVLGVVVYFYLDDRPDQARWLTPEERTWLLERLQRDAERPQQHHSLLDGLSSSRIWLLSVLYFAMVIVFYGFNLWLPQIIQAIPGLREAQVRLSSQLPISDSWAEWLSGLDDFWIGVLTALPGLCSIFAMILVGRSSDRTGERRWHIAVSAVISAVGLIGAAYSNSLLASMLWLSLAGAAMRSALGPFWALATSFLGGTAAAGGIALINSIGNLGGYVGPTIVATMKEERGGFRNGLISLAVSLAAAGMLALIIRPQARQTKQLVSSH